MNEQLEMIELRPIPPSLLSLANVSEWSAMEVSDPVSEQTCGERMDLLYKRARALEAERDSVVQPLRLAIKRIDAMVKPILEPLTEAYATLNRKLGAYLADKRRREEEIARKARDEEAAILRAAAAVKANAAVVTNDIVAFETAAKEEQTAMIVAAAPVKAPQKTQVGAAQFIAVRRWKWKLVDPNLVPREYLMIDTVKLNAVATRYAKNPIEVPGVSFFEETTTARRS